MEEQIYLAVIKRNF